MSKKGLVTSSLQPANAIYNDVLEAGEPWIHEVQTGQVFRIENLGGNQTVDALFYNTYDYTERYSVTDTILAQKNIYLTAGSRLMSNRSNTLLTIVADTCGRHDTLGGACASESNMVRYALDKRYMHTCRNSFLKAIGDWGCGMEKRDIVSNINFFLNAQISADGKLDFADGLSAPGKYVEMRAEMDVLVLISNCPQLNNACNAYNPTPVRLLIWDARG